MDELTVVAWRKSFRGAIPASVIDAQRPGPRGDYFRSALPSLPPYHTAVVTDEGRVVGYVHTGPNRDDDDAGESEIWGLYVDPGHQRRGFGRTLMEHALEWVGSQGYSEVTLWTLKDVLTTRRFYEAMGGRVDPIERSVSIHGTDLQEVRYRFRLSEV